MVSVQLIPTFLCDAYGIYPHMVVVKLIMRLLIGCPVVRSASV